MTIIIFVTFSSSSDCLASRAASFSASACTSAFTFSASSFLPSFIRAPICLDSAFLAAFRSSASRWDSRLSLSRAITSSTRGSLSSWNFFLMFSFTASGFSLKNLMSSMFPPGVSDSLYIINYFLSILYYASTNL